jgi:hypothetical protein
MGKLVLFGLLLAGGLAGQGGTGWRVWVKVSPCSMNIDWITLAKDNPTGGGNYYETADRIKSPEAIGIRVMPQFFDYCCKDYSFIGNDTTKELFAYRGWTAKYGFTVVNEGVCCEEAAAITGHIVSACPLALLSVHPPVHPPVRPVSPLGARGSMALPTSPAGTYLGCFRDTSDFDLNGNLERSRSNTPQRCIENCRRRGFPLAAVQYGESCLCGDSYGLYGNADNCNMLCTGDPSKICGGSNANMVFATGLPGAQVITTGGYRPPPEGGVTTGSRPPTITRPPPTVGRADRVLSASRTVYVLKLLRLG